MQTSTRRSWDSHDGSISIIEGNHDEYTLNVFGEGVAILNGVDLWDLSEMVTAVLVSEDGPTVTGFDEDGDPEYATCEGCGDYIYSDIPEYTGNDGEDDDDPDSTPLDNKCDDKEVIGQNVKCVGDVCTETAYYKDGSCSKRYAGSCNSENTDKSYRGILDSERCIKLLNSLTKGDDNYLDLRKSLSERALELKEDGDYETCDLIREARNTIEKLTLSKSVAA